MIKNWHTLQLLAHIGTAVIRNIMHSKKCY